MAIPAVASEGTDKIPTESPCVSRSYRVPDATEDRQINLTALRRLLLVEYNPMMHFAGKAAFLAVILGAAIYAQARPLHAGEERAGEPSSSVHPTDENRQEVVTFRVAFVPLRSSTSVLDVASLRVFDEFFRRHPNYRYESTTGIALPEGMNEAQSMMAFAGERGPDVFDLSIRQVQNYIRLGLLYPLDDLIAQHKREHPGWEPPSLGLTEDHWDAARGEDGALYALVYNYWILATWYRRDLFEEAGIIPVRPPADWNEYFEFAQRLTQPHKRVKGAKFHAGQYGTGIRTGYEAGFIFTNFVYQAGGHMTMQQRTCPDDGTVNEFPKEDRACVCNACGRSLTDQPRRWIATYGREPGQRALRFYKDLRWTEWTRCPGCDTPNNLPVVVCPQCREPNPVRAATQRLSCRVCKRALPVPADKREFYCKECRRELRDAPVYTGVVRVGDKPPEMFMRGEIAMMLDHLDPRTIDDVMTLGALRPDQIGFGPPPRAPGEGGVQAALTGGRAWCLSAQAARDPRVLQAAWDYLVYQCSEEAQRLATDVYVKNGYAHLIRPELLRQFGYDEEYEDYEPSFRKAMETAPQYGRVQPHDLNYQHVESTELAVPVDSIVFQGGQYLDPAKVIQQSMDRTNEKLYRIVPPEVIRRRNFWGSVVFCLVAPMVVAAFIYTLRAKSESHAGTLASKAAQVVGAGAGRRRNLVIACCVMAPALLTVGMWEYLPLFRGTAMAFFDYRIYGGSKFVGLQNFIEVMTSPDFWNSVRATVFYVGTSLSIGFCAPILLALLLSEVPKGKIFYRTMFYMPAVTTGLVIMFLWKMLYAPTPTGFLNRLAMPVLHFFHLVGSDVTHIDWLHTPGIALVCVVIPGVWAGAGPGSLIYLAALKTVPEDLYESIAIDGGTFVHKIRHVMYPAIRPLIMINFIGAFIGTFHAMQNVFVMTGGGPANSTMVLGIHIWANAFLYLRFGYATAMAWVLGSTLIGFTVLQLRILKRVEFRAAHQMQ